MVIFDYVVLSKVANRFSSWIFYEIGSVNFNLVDCKRVEQKSFQMIEQYLKMIEVESLYKWILT